MFWLRLCRLLVLIYTATAQTQPSPTPPQEHKHETGRPKNMNNCRFNAYSIFPWIVGVWDTEYGGYVGHGSMITYIAFITACRRYTNTKPSAYTVIGQFIWNVSLPNDPCMQERIIAAIQPHPKCYDDRTRATFFDFAVFSMKDPFLITGLHYPIIRLPRSVHNLYFSIRNINRQPNTTGCSLQYFRNQQEKPPIFDPDSSVQSIPFHTKCAWQLCEKRPPQPESSRICEVNLQERANGTMLCFKNKKESLITLGKKDVYWYAGSPLVCNRIVYGIASQIKGRRRYNYPHNWDDIHFVVTFLRVWPWIIERKLELSVPWRRNSSIEFKPKNYKSARSDVLPLFISKNLRIVLLCHPLVIFLLSNHSFL